jgi:hypothetical protein
MVQVCFKRSIIQICSVYITRLFYKFNFMKRNHKIMALSVVGLLALTVISAATINSLPLAKAGCDGNCKNEAYGNLISDEAQNPNNKPGYGDEVSPLAQDETDPTPDGQNGLKEFRQSGVDARDRNGDGPGQSDEDHGNDD